MMRIWCWFGDSRRWGDLHSVTVRGSVNRKKRTQYDSRAHISLKKIIQHTWTWVKTLRHHTRQHTIIATFVFPWWNINYYDKQSQIGEAVRIVLNIYCTLKRAHLFMAVKRFPNNLFFRVFRTHVIFITEYAYLVAVTRFRVWNKKWIFCGRIEYSFFKQISIKCKKYSIINYLQLNSKYFGTSVVIILLYKHSLGFKFTTIMYIVYSAPRWPDNDETQNPVGTIL
jgi:hypothetical protein